MTLDALLPGHSTSVGATIQFFNVVGFSNATVNEDQRAVAFNAVSERGLVSAKATQHATVSPMQPTASQQDDQGFFLIPAPKVDVTK